MWLVLPQLRTPVQHWYHPSTRSPGWTLITQMCQEALCHKQSHNSDYATGGQGEETTPLLTLLMKNAGARAKITLWEEQNVKELWELSEWKWQAAGFLVFRGRNSKSGLHQTVWTSQCHHVGGFFPLKLALNRDGSSLIQCQHYIGGCWTWGSPVGLLYPILKSPDCQPRALGRSGTLEGLRDISQGEGDNRSDLMTRRKVCSREALGKQVLGMGLKRWL